VCILMFICADVHLLLRPKVKGAHENVSEAKKKAKRERVAFRGARTMTTSRCLNEHNVTT
jgi:hypothetical protein